MKFIPTNPGGPWNPRQPSAAIAAIGAAPATSTASWPADVVTAHILVLRLEAARRRAVAASEASRAANLAAR